MKMAIVGGGAAGLMAAASALASHPQAEIFLLEKNDGLGKKVIISGGGRCNVTTGIADVKTVLSKYPRGGKFLTSAMYAFPPSAIVAWFERHGVPLKTEADLRVFPQSDDGHDIVRVFERLFRDPRVHVMLRSSVELIARRGAEFTLQLRGGEMLVVDRVVLTTGGQAYRQTGSTGDGYAFATALGHTITTLAPSLSSLLTRETWPSMISGVSLPSAKLTAHVARPVSFTGPFLFTHFGVSGPAVFALSSLVAFEQIDAQHPLAMTIDLFPDVPSDTFRDQLFVACQAHGRKDLQNILATLVLRSLAEVAVAQLGLGDVRGADVTKKMAMDLAQWMKAMPLTIVGRRAGDEFVTAGGVALLEVDPKTMESLVTPGLYFAGEILDIDGFTGGFNLTASWATGRLAGASAVS